MKNCNVISHRGANQVAPQNTIEAFEKSIEIGCDGFETDIHLTKDGKGYWQKEILFLQYLLPQTGGR